MVGHVKRELFDLVAQLTRSGRSLVIATVVRREGLSSAHQGDMAIVTEDGEFHGWIGGGCTRPTIEREAAVALQTRKPRLIVLSPDPARDPRPGVLVFPMTCHSGGTVEIYLDPIIASPRLALFGRSPIISALGTLAHAIGYLVDVADPDAQADELPGADRIFTTVEAPELAGAAFVVVGTMGDFDEEAVIRAIALEPKYVGVIASRRRYALLCDALLARGISTELLSAIANPAGLDLGAREPGEVAVSILAQIVARRNEVAVVRESGASIDGQGSAPLTEGQRGASSGRGLPSAGSVAEARGSSGGQGSAAEARGSSIGQGTAEGQRGSSVGQGSAPTGEGQRGSGIGRSSPSAGSVAEGQRGSSIGQGGAATPASTPLTAIDPVCKMTVTIATAKHVAEWDNRSWYFCCGGCKTKFLATPTAYDPDVRAGLAR